MTQPLNALHEKLHTSGASIPAPSSPSTTEHSLSGSPPTTTGTEPWIYQNIDEGQALSDDDEEKEEIHKKEYQKAQEPQVPEISDADKQFFIVDKSTGQVFDIRNESSMETLNSIQGSLTTLKPQEKKLPWDEWWKEKKKANKELLHAADKGNIKRVRELLDSSKKGDLIADIHTCNTDMFTALHIAVNEKNAELAKFLLSQGADPESVTANKKTALHIAAQRGSTEMMQILLEAPTMKKANINAQDEKGDTPCHILVENGHSEQLVWLLSHYKPDLSIKNNKGEVVSDRKYCAEPQSMTGKIQRYDTHVDMIKKLILEGERANKLASGRSSITAKPVSPAVHPELEAGSSKIRRIKIIEASKKVADHAATKEDAGKEEEKKELSNNNIPVGPQDFLPIQTLGRGAFGEVYLVKFAKTGKLYAMKTQNKRRIIRQNIVKYAQTERNVLSYCKHPFIVGLDFAFQTSERLFLVMDYCPGGDLGHLLTKEKRLTEDRARVYAAEVFLALEYLHSKDIIFRDLKPDNVVMDEDGHVLLTDFGLSKEAMPDHAASQSFLGSVAYLAPEIVKGVGHGKPVDWYLLGVLIYELLVGKPPYFSENREVMYRKT